MKTFLGGAALSLVLAIMAGPANAKGCIKGAVVGAIAGHAAHHHAVLGAVTGCVVGHHLAHRHEQPVQAPANGSQPARPAAGSNM